MKKQIVSNKYSSVSIYDFKIALKDARNRKLKGEYFEWSFDYKWDFDRFVKILRILLATLDNQPKSVYELAKFVDIDVSSFNNPNDLFESMVAIKIKSRTVSRRAVKTPIVEFEQTEVDLKVAS